MSLKNCKKLNANTIEMEIAIDKKAFDDAVSASFKKRAAKMNVPGFRRGKAPRAVIEKMYGKGVFYDDALNGLLPDAYEEAVSSSGETPVGQPKFDVVSLEEEVVIKATVTVKPEVTLKAYRDLPVTRVVAPVTEEEVSAAIEQVRSRNSRMIDVTDRPAQLGDTAVIDYEGFLDGTPFDGGKGEKFNLALGSGQFIPGFEDQIVGHNPGDAFDVNVTFPDDYQAEDLQGKQVVFKVVLHEIKFNELPDLDDDFAKDVSEFDTLAEYKADVEAKIKENHEKTADSEVENQLVEQLIANLEADIPEDMYAAETEQQLRDYDNRLRGQGLDLGTYLKYTGSTLDQLREQFRPRAEHQVKARLALEKVAELEKLEATDADIEDEIKKISDAYHIDAEEIKKQVTNEMLSADIQVGKAVDFIKANAVITEKAPDADEKAPEADEKAPTAKPKRTAKKKSASTEKNTDTDKAE